MANTFQPDNTFEININSFGGLAPAYFSNTYSSIGAKGQANNLNEIDLLDPSCVSNARKIVAYSGNMVVTTLTSILRTPAFPDACFAGGGNKIHRFSSTVLAGSPYPLTLAMTGSTGDEAISDIFYYKDVVLITYSYTKASPSAARSDIAILDLGSVTIDPDWGSTVPSGASLLVASKPHYMCQGGNDAIYITNGRYIASVKKPSTTFILETEDLDLWDDSVNVSITWNNDQLYIANVRPNITGSNYNQSAIYRWNTVAPTWDGDPIEVPGKIGALYTMNGVTYVWYSDATGSTLAYVNGTIIQPIKRFRGTAPNHNQVGEVGGYLMWVGSDASGNNTVFLYGQADVGLDYKMFQYAYGAGRGASSTTTIGAISAPFNSLVVSSKDADSPATYYLGGFIGTASYSALSNYYTSVFNLTSSDKLATIDTIRVVTEPLTANSKLDIYLKYNQNASSLKLTPQISGTGKTVHTMNIKSLPYVSDFRIMLDWSVTSQVTAPIKVKSIHVKGHYINSQDIR